MPEALQFSKSVRKLEEKLPKVLVFNPMGMLGNANRSSSSGQPDRIWEPSGKQASHPCIFENPEGGITQVSRLLGSTRKKLNQSTGSW